MCGRIGKGVVEDGKWDRKENRESKVKVRQGERKAGVREGKGKRKQREGEWSESSSVDRAFYTFTKRMDRDDGRVEQKIGEERKRREGGGE
jgi:hypothetical protein